jgi:hypothetical protein
MRYEIKEDYKTKYRHSRKGKLTLTQTTFSEFVEMSNREDVEHGEWGSDCKEKGSFYGNIGSYQEMYDACYNGMGVKKMLKARADLGALLNHEVEEPRKAVVGEALNVGAYCNGNPFHYYKDADEFAKPRVHIVYSTNAVAGVSATQFTRHGGAICALVDQLAQQVDVKISLYISNEGVFRGNGCQVVTIKDYEDVVDVPRVSATAHPSFFRRIGFTWFENAGKLIHESIGSGYGGSRTGTQRSKYIISDDDFRDWVGMTNDEMVVDFPAPDETQFKNNDDTARWLKMAISTIENGVQSNENIVKLFGLC